MVLITIIILLVLIQLCIFYARYDHNYRTPVVHMLLIVYTIALTDPKLRCITYKRRERVRGGGGVANNNSSPSYFLFI